MSDAESKGGTIFEARIAVIKEIKIHTYPDVLFGSNIGTRLDELIAAVRENERKRTRQNV
jgi:hypothetical protein